MGFPNGIELIHVDDLHFLQLRKNVNMLLQQKSLIGEQVKDL